VRIDLPFYIELVEYHSELLRMRGSPVTIVDFSDPRHISAGDSVAILEL
jgi:hypothetical protein